MRSFRPRLPTWEAAAHPGRLERSCVCAQPGSPSLAHGALLPVTPACPHPPQPQSIPAEQALSTGLV